MKQLVALLLPLILLAACGGQPDKAGAGHAVEAYLQAKAAANLDELVKRSCPAWEAQAHIEATSFQSMNAQLENVSCTVGEADGDFTLVTCTGKITTTYQGEAREWPVDNQAYQTLFSDGEWLMCGYK